MADDVVRLNPKRAETRQIELLVERRPARGRIAQDWTAAVLRLVLDEIGHSKGTVRLPYDQRLAEPVDIMLGERVIATARPVKDVQQAVELSPRAARALVWLLTDDQTSAVDILWPFARKALGLDEPQRGVSVEGLGRMAELLPSDARYALAQLDKTDAKGKKRPFYRNGTKTKSATEGGKGPFNWNSPEFLLTRQQAFERAAPNVAPGLLPLTKAEGEGVAPQVAVLDFDDVILNSGNPVYRELVVRAWLAGHLIEQSYSGKGLHLFYKPNRHSPAEGWVDTALGIDHLFSAAKCCFVSGRLIAGCDSKILELDRAFCELLKSAHYKDKAQPAGLEKDDPAVLEQIPAYKPLIAVNDDSSFRDHLDEMSHRARWEQREVWPRSPRYTTALVTVPFRERTMLQQASTLAHWRRQREWHRKNTKTPWLVECCPRPSEMIAEIDLMLSTFCDEQMGEYPFWLQCVFSLAWATREFDLPSDDVFELLDRHSRRGKHPMRGYDFDDDEAEASRRELWQTQLEREPTTRETTVGWLIREATEAGYQRPWEREDPEPEPKGATADQIMSDYVDDADDVEAEAGPEQMADDVADDESDEIEDDTEAEAAARVDWLTAKMMKKRRDGDPDWEIDAHKIATDELKRRGIDLYLPPPTRLPPLHPCAYDGAISPRDPCVFDVSDRDEIMKVWNARYIAVPDQGDKMPATIYRRRRDGTLRAYPSIRNFHDAHSHQKVRLSTKGAGTFMQASKWWHSQHDRVEPELIYRPGIEVSPDEFLNEWTGFGVMPVKRSCERLKRHLYETACSGIDVEFVDFWRWLVYNVHFPYISASKAVILYTKEGGTGKSRILEFLVAMFGKINCLESDMRELTGEFNSGIRNKNFGAFDEVDKREGGKISKVKLRRLIGTSSARSRGLFQAHSTHDHCMSVIGATNDLSTVPIDGRRLWMPTVSEARKGDDDYFHELNRATRELPLPGEKVADHRPYQDSEVEGLLWELMMYKLPKDWTPAKMRPTPLSARVSLEHNCPVFAWLSESLWNGAWNYVAVRDATMRHSDATRGDMEIDVVQWPRTWLHDAFLAHQRARNPRSEPMPQREFIETLARHVGGIREVRARNWSDPRQRQQTDDAEDVRRPRQVIMPDLNTIARKILSSDDYRKWSQPPTEEDDE